MVKLRKQTWPRPPVMQPRIWRPIGVLGCNKHTHWAIDWQIPYLMPNLNFACEWARAGSLVWAAAHLTLHSPPRLARHLPVEAAQ